MHFALSECLANMLAKNTANIHVAGMLAVLVIGLSSGYIAANFFGMPEHWAKKIMTAVLVSFNWLISLLVIWQLQLSTQLIWLPIIGLALMLTITVLSAAVFSLFDLDLKSRLTLILAGGLSNLGYTGGAFICYALFGMVGLALANLYSVLWEPTAYFVFFPLLKTYELRRGGGTGGFKLSGMLDCRFLSIPAITVAVILNLAGTRPPAFIADFRIIDLFVYAASAMSFFAIGLRVNLSRLRNNVKMYFPLIGVKFILTPIMAILIITLLAATGQNLTGLVRKVIMVQSVMPSAVLTVTMSNVFDLDGPLASAVWVVTTAVFVTIVVPVLFFIFT